MNNLKVKKIIPFITASKSLKRAKDLETKLQNIV